MTPAFSPLDSIFKPRSLAVIGASNDPSKWGYFMVERPLRTGYKGAIYPVNPQVRSLLGLKAYRSVTDIPDQVDLAVITVQSQLVPSVMQQCVDKGVKGAIIISAGFAEANTAGKELEARTAKIAKAGGIRFVGPNCMGIWSAAGHLNNVFQLNPKPGNIAFVSQSGTFGLYMSQLAESRGYGLRTFVSVGNQADLQIADYVEYLQDDDDTKAIILYVEGIKDGRRFFDVCKSAIRKKPIILYKGGSSPAGARATLSHTASIAGSDVVFQTACHQLGLIRTEEAFQTFEVAIALLGLPLPPGRRVGILGTGGQAVVATDACQRLGLDVPELERATSDTLMKLMPAHAPRPRNPVDFAGSYRTAVDEAKVVETLLEQDNIDAAICNVPVNPYVWGWDFEKRGEPTTLEELGAEVVQGVHTLCGLPAKYRKPVVCLRWSRAVRRDLVADALVRAGIPVYDTPEQCARALYALNSYAEVRRRTRSA